MRLILILIVAAWGTGVVLAIAHTIEKGRDARLTAAYLLGWPLLALVLYFNEPVPLWLALPTTLGLIPWLLAWPHLSAVLKNPIATRSHGLIGIPAPYWLWGGSSALLLGILLE